MLLCYLFILHDIKSLDQAEVPTVLNGFYTFQIPLQLFVVLSVNMGYAQSNINQYQAKKRFIHQSSSRKTAVRRRRRKKNHFPNKFKLNSPGQNSSFDIVSQAENL